MICPGWIFPQTRVEKAEVLEFIINHHWRHDGPVLIRIVCLMLTVKALYFKGRSWEYRNTGIPIIHPDVWAPTSNSIGSRIHIGAMGTWGPWVQAALSIYSWLMHLYSADECVWKLRNTSKWSKVAILFFWYVSMWNYMMINQQTWDYIPDFQTNTDVTDVWIYVSDLWRRSCLHHQVNKHEDDIAYCFFCRAVGRSKFQRVVWSLCLNLRNSSQSLLSGNIAVCHLESCRFLDNLTWSKDLPTSSNKRQESVTSVPLQHEFLHPPKSKCISGPQPLFPTAVPILKYPWHQQKVKGSNVKHNHLKPFQRPWFLPIPKSYNEHLCIHTNITWHYTTSRITLHCIALHYIALHSVTLHGVI